MNHGVVIPNRLSTVEIGIYGAAVFGRRKPRYHQRRPISLAASQQKRKSTLLLAVGSSADGLGVQPPNWSHNYTQVDYLRPAANDRLKAPRCISRPKHQLSEDIVDYLSGASWSRHVFYVDFPH